MRKKFINTLKQNRNHDIYFSILKAAENTFPKEFQASKIVPTKESLLFWALHMEQRAESARHQLKEKAKKMKLASTLLKNEVQKHPSSYRNKQLISLVETIYSEAPMYTSLKVQKYYIAYTYNLFSNLLSKRYDKPILPQMLLKALPQTLPQIFLGSSPPESPSSWSEILDWCYKLSKMSKEAEYIPEYVGKARRLYVAAEIIGRSVIILKAERNPIGSMLDWNWCPLCWRPVENHTGRDKCKRHQTGAPEYQRILRLLRKLTPPPRKFPAWIPVKDKIPIELKQIYRGQVLQAFDSGFPLGWESLPNTKKYLQKENPEVDLSNVDDCIDVLSPGALSFFKKAAVDFLNLSNPTRREMKESDGELFLRGTKESFLTRAETWLSIASNINRGGARKNAGRRPLTDKARRKRFRKISSTLREKRRDRLTRSPNFET